MSAPVDVITAQAHSTDESSALARLLANAAILIVDNDPDTCQLLQQALAPRSALVETAIGADEADALRQRYHFDVLIVDTGLVGLSGLAWLGQLRERGLRTSVIFTSAAADLQMAITAIRHGADDFVQKPYRIEDIARALHRALERRPPSHMNPAFNLQMQRLMSEQGVVGESPAIRATLDLAHRVAPTSTTVLIEGETGTGKELVARTVHALDRRPGAFVAINCGSVPSELFESELFGHIRGAFSGAVQSREGLVMHADRGTLFLDEIGEMPLAMQAKLLRVLDESVIRPVGAEREVAVDVRVLAATNRDLEAMVAAGSFRQDLYFRLNVLPIHVPPLRDRLDDLPLLISHFMECLSAEMSLEPVELMHTDHERLRNWPWPGNVRELRNVIERTLLLGRLPADSLRAANSEPDQRQAALPVGHGFPLDWSLQAVERAHIQSVLAAHGNNKSAAARPLGVSRKTLERKQQLWDRESSS